MRCQRCQTQNALEKNGAPALLSLFEEIEGYFCARCVLELQHPYNLRLRRSIAERASSLTDADLAAVPDQMLKFTMCFPVQAPPARAKLRPRAGSARRS